MYLQFPCVTIVEYFTYFGVLSGIARTAHRERYVLKRLQSLYIKGYNGSLGCLLKIL